MNFQIIDFIFIALIGLFMIRCYLKGFVGEFFSIAAVVLGFLAALFFYKNGGEYLRAQFMPEIKIIPEILAFIALFLIIFLVIKLLEILLKEIINGISLSGADRVLGIIFGFVQGVAVVSLILFVLNIQPLFDPKIILSESFFADLLLPLITGNGVES